MKEPKGTRMQVVKGFSDLTWNFLNHELGQPMHKLPGCKHYKPRRHQVECHSPKWEGDHWVCSYVLDEHVDEPQHSPLATIEFWPDGRFELRLFTRDDKVAGIYVYHFEPPADVPRDEKVRSFFWSLMDSGHGKRLAEHLVENTELREGSKPSLL